MVMSAKSHFNLVEDIMNYLTKDFVAMAVNERNNKSKLETIRKDTLYGSTKNIQVGNNVLSYITKVFIESKNELSHLEILVPN